MLGVSCNYFVTITGDFSYGIVSLLIAVVLTIPSAKYYLRVSVIKDFDFVNIFLQSSILKSVIFGVIELVLYFSNYLFI